MDTIYFDCFSGISGDMILGALLDAGLYPKDLKNELAKLNLSPFEIRSKQVIKNHIKATQVEVIAQGKNRHRSLTDLYDIIGASELDKDIKQKAKAVFLKIAHAEAKIHGIALEKVHFHEIGALDTIIDVVGVLVGLKKMGVEKIYCSKLNVGNGFVNISHGKFPVPAPATTEILKGIPIYSTDSKGELVTPTGAAIVASLATGFGSMPAIETKQIGYGAGQQDLEHPNVLRVLIGELVPIKKKEQDEVYVIEANIDDMNPQYYGHVMDRLFQKGALDVYLTNISMKKNRPAIKLSVISTPDDKEGLIDLILRETTTIGVRIRREQRKVLERDIQKTKTRYGVVRIKRSKLNGKIIKTKPEYDDCKKLAEENEVPLKEVYGEID